MDAQDVVRYTNLFNNALVYTISIGILTHIINTANISALPVVITTVIGIATMVIQTTAHVRQEKPQYAGTMWWDALDLGETMLRYATDILVQFSGQAVSKLVLHAFENSTDDASTFTGVVMAVTLLYSLTRAASRPVKVAIRRRRE